MLFQCLSGPKLLPKVGNRLNIRTAVVPSHYPRNVLSPFKGFSSSTNILNVRTALKAHRRLSSTIWSPPSVSTNCEVRRKNVMLTSLDHVCNMNIKTPSSMVDSHAPNSILNGIHQEFLLPINHRRTQSSSFSSLVPSCIPHQNTLCNTSQNSNRSTQLPHNLLLPSHPKVPGTCGLHSRLLSCNSGGQLCVGSHRGLHSSPRCHDIYIIENEEEFENKVMNSKLPVVINFHADWCEPCHALKPLLESLAEKHQGKMHLAEIKVDDHVALLHTFEVTAVPAVLGVVKGQVTEKFVGLISETEVRAFINTMISN